MIHHLINVKKQGKVPYFGEVKAKNSFHEKYTPEEEFYVLPDKFPSPIRLPMPFPAPPGDDVADRVVDPEEEPSESGPRSAPGPN